MAFYEQPGPPQGQNPCPARKRRRADAPLEAPGAKCSKIAELGRKLYSARIILQRCDETAEPASTGSCQGKKRLGKDVGVGPAPPKLRRLDSALSLQNTIKDRGVAARECRLGARARYPQIVLTKCDATLVRPSPKDTSITSKVSKPVPAQPHNTHRPKLPELDIRIAQLNMSRSHPVAGELRQLVETQKLDILLLQEPPARVRGGVHTCGGLGLGTKYVASHDKKPWAAIAVTNPQLEILKISQLSNQHCVCAEIIAPSFSFYVVSHYFQFSGDREEHLRHLEKVVRSLRGKRLIIGMDCNAESSLWSPRDTDDNGANIAAMIQETDLIVQNEKSQPPTYETENGESYIDVTLSSQSMSDYIREWKVRRDWTCSDHNAIEIRIAAPSASDNRLVEANRFNVDKADWRKFNQSLTDISKSVLEPLPLRSRDDVEAMARSLTCALTDACQGSMPRKKKHKVCNPWWNKDLSSAKKELNRLKRAFKREKDETKYKELVQKYRDCKRSYKKLIKKERVDSWRGYATSVGNDEPYGLVYKQCADKVCPQKAVSSLKTAAGTTMGMLETAETLLNVHIPDDSTENDPPALRRIRKSVKFPPDTEDTPPFMAVEVKMAVSSFKNKKAPGTDLVEVTVLKKAIQVIPTQIVKLINGCLQHGVFPEVWKEGSLRLLIKGDDKDETDPKSYRPICLLSVLGKLFEKLLVMRLSKTSLAQDRISARQFGFTKGKSTEDAIVELRKTVETCVARYLVAMLFDVQGAFDNVLHAIILRGLKESGCQKNIYKVMQDYFSNRTVRIAWSDQVVSKKATKGCPQGSVMGPPCWNISFDLLLQMLNEILGVTFLAYADDLVVLIEAQTRNEITAKCQQVVNKVLDWSRISKLQISRTKTEGIYLKVGSLDRKPLGRRKIESNFRSSTKTKPNVKSRYPVVKLGDKSIGFKEKVKYLGVVIDKGFHFSSHCNHLRNKVAPLFQKLKRVAQKTWGLNATTTSIIYKACFGPTVAYAAAGWAQSCTVHNLRSLEAIQHTALLPVVHAYRSTSTDALCVLSGSLPVEILLKQRVALYNLRKGREATIGEITLCGHSQEKEEKIEAEAVRLWQSRWNSSEKGRTTYKFIADIKERLAKQWLRPNHSSAQVLTGHGNFAQKLESQRLATSGSCRCGEPDTAEHLLFYCPKNSDIRQNLIEQLGKDEMPAEEHFYVSTPETFQIFTRFCEESLHEKPASSSKDARLSI